MSKGLLILCGACLSILLLSGSSKGQDKDSIKVSKNALIECELDHAQLVFVAAQLDSVIENRKPKPLNIKEKALWGAVGAAVIIIIRLAIK